MIAWKLRLWRAASAAAVLGLAACGADGGEAGEAGSAGEAGEAAAVSSETPAPAASAGGEAGESGAATVYAGLSGDQLTALRIQHLRGFVMAAERMVEDRPGETGGPEQAAVLVQQGLLEVYDPASEQFGALDVGPLRDAAAGASLSRAQMQQRLRASQDALNRAVAGLDVDDADLVARMVDISTGIYEHVIQDDFVDPIEYTHSMGAALAARQALVLHQDELRRRNLRAYSQALGELTRFTELWPSNEPPAQPATYQQVLAQGSRVRLALSPFL